MRRVRGPTSGGHTVWRGSGGWRTWVAFWCLFVCVCVCVCVYCVCVRVVYPTGKTVDEAEGERLTLGKPPALFASAALVTVTPMVLCGKSTLTCVWGEGALME